MENNLKDIKDISITKNINYFSKEKNNNNFFHENILKNKRNYGIDLLRIFSMINVIILHINSYSHLLIMNNKNPKFKSVWLSEIMSHWAVDGFGIISGIVGYKKSKFSNLFYLWIQTFFYSTVFSLYLYIKNNNTKWNLFLSFFPLLIKRHWYVNAYFYMYQFLPFINYGINNINKNYFRNLIIFFLLINSIYDMIGYIIIKTNSNFHFLNSGYSAMWLAILYIIGGYLGKYIFSNKKIITSFYFIFWIIIYLFSSFFTFAIFFILLKKKSKIPCKLLINYLSPTIVLESISLIFIFSRLNIKNNIIKKIIVFFTPLTFNTTLIHIRLFTDNNFHHTKKLLSWIKEFKSNFIFFKIYGMAILIYIGCSLIDYLRLILFRLLKIREFCVLIENIFFK